MQNTAIKIFSAALYYKWNWSVTDDIITLYKSFHADDTDTYDGYFNEYTYIKLEVQHDKVWSNTRFGNASEEVIEIHFHFPSNGDNPDPTLKAFADLILLDKCTKFI